MYAIYNNNGVILDVSKRPSNNFNSIQITDAEAKSIKSGMITNFNYHYDEETGVIQRVEKIKPADWSETRKIRDSLLNFADNYAKILYDNQVLGTDISASEVLVAEYRQALRMIPQTFASPKSVIWPDSSFMNKK